MRCFLLIALCLLFSAPLRADTNWPQFRGPGADAHANAQNLPVQWSQEKNVAWKTPLPGEGWSSPVVVGPWIYLTAAVPVEEGSDDYSLRLLKVNAKSGELADSLDVFFQNGETASSIHGKNSHASPTPLAHGDHIYVHFGHQGTACVSPAEWKVLWRNRSLAYRPVHGNGGSPIVVDDKLIFSCDGAEDPFVVALDRYTGQEVWRTPRSTDATKKFSFSTPLLIQAGGKPQVISPGSDCVCSYDPNTGREIWRVQYDGYSVIPQPVFRHGLVFISTCFNRAEVMAIRPTGQADVTGTHVKWTLSRGAPHTPSLLVVGDELYMVSDLGVATCVDARSGKIHWQERLGGPFSASPIYADGKIYFQSEEGDTTVIKPGTKLIQLAENSLGERTLASYAVTDSTIFIRGEKHLYRIERLEQ